jgi:hypothetical protein
VVLSDSFRTESLNPFLFSFDSLASSFITLCKLSEDLVPYSANISIQTKTSSWAKAGQNASLCNFTDSVFWDVLFFLASFFQLLERLFVRRMITEGLESVYDRLQVWTMKPEADYQTMT